MLKIIFKVIGSGSTTFGILQFGPTMIKEWFDYDILLWPEWLKISVFVIVIILGITGAIFAIRFSDNSSNAETVPEHAVETGSAVTQGIVIGAITATLIGAVALALILKNKD